MSLTAWRSALTDYIAREARPVEKFGHQPRLYELTLRIGADMLYDDDVVFAAAWLHDLGVFVGHRPEEPEALARWNNVTYAMERAPAILNDLGFPREKIAHVLDCIRTHQPQGEPATLEAMILRDADILEQLGAVGILRTVCKVGRDTRFRTFTEAASSLHVALVELPRELRLDSSKDLAMPRVEQLASFLAAVEAESGEHLH